jgi:hypothetical protein
VMNDAMFPLIPGTDSPFRPSIEIPDNPLQSSHPFPPFHT